MTKGFISQCEQEALHRSGMIQPHGSLLICSADLQVTHASGNIAEHTGREPHRWLGQKLPKELASLDEMLSKEPGARTIVSRTLDDQHSLDVVVTRSQHGGLILELLPCLEEWVLDIPKPPILPPPPASNEELLSLRRALLAQIAKLTGAHRVMYYAFHPSEDGEVLDEICDDTVAGTYLGLRYPASDIPMVARQLYLKNPWRSIPDAQAAPVPILSLNADALADLTWSDLRSVSPVHVIYLANMGVKAALSFPVAVGGGLTALVSAHYQIPIILPPRLLDNLSQQVRNFAHALALWQSQQRIRLIDGLNRRLEALQHVIRRHGDPISAWPELAQGLIEEFDVDGATLCIDQQHANAGSALEPMPLAVLDDWFGEQSDEAVWCSDHLSGEVRAFPLSEIAGVMAVRIRRPGNRSIRIYLSRTEYIHDVSWGGNPHKPVEYHDGQLGIAPRRSFEKWVERRIGYSRPWSNEARLLALRLRDVLQQGLVW
ncbi:hypothetical protein [Azonexus sp. IMCC34839]|uniref:hypothetical protein n=1 Tax=Azonexus sp. IMCC34839 TaxID=3133695 RepID=UPI00399A3093